MKKFIIAITILVSSLFSEEWVKSIFQKYQNSIVRVNNLMKGNVIGQGTGFIVDETGIIVTNFHVVVGAEKVEVITIDDEKYTVDGFYSYDSLKDYAIMKIPGFSLTRFPF